MNNDWYRKTAWTKKDKEDFFLRLGRAKFQAPQYAKIQALTLLGLNKPELIPEAIDLFNFVLEKWPETPYLNVVYAGLAECYEKLNEVPKALEYYRLSLEQEEKRPNIIGTADLGYGLLVAKNKIRDHYATVNDLLTKRSTHFVFPQSKFMAYAIFALINADRAEKELAKSFAEKALTEAGLTESGFKKHKDIGLVGKNEKDLIDLMKMLV